MPNPKTSEKSNYLDREENITKGNVSAKRTAIYTYNSGADTVTPVNSSNPLPITGSITASASTLADYSVNDIDDTTSTEYYGFTKPDATWQVKKVVSSGVSYATVTNNGSVADYTTAWTNRATLTYGRFDEAF